MRLNAASTAQLGTQEWLMKRALDLGRLRRPDLRDPQPQPEVSYKTGYISKALTPARNQISNDRRGGGTDREERHRAR